MLFSLLRARHLTASTFALASLLAGALCSVRPATAAETSTTFTNAFDLTFDRPVVLAEIPGKTEEFLVVEQSGKIQRVARENGRWKKSEFASFKTLGGKRWEDERGLLGLAFHPRFAENRLYYVNYVSPLENTVVEERRAREDGSRDSETYARKILEVEQPYGNHNGGSIGFGSDGFLYIGMGDGGSGGDPHNYAQDPESLLGKMLRINVDQRDSGAAYSIPRDNPFIRKPTYRPEIWALGLRNPWKWTFHPVTGSLWVGDVGQGEREEISIVPRGGNMGWRVLEADRCFEGPNCNRKGFVPPVVSLPRSEARSITGGEFYLANRASRHYGAYIFGDYKTGHVWALRRRGGRWDRTIIGNVASVSAFARDTRGDVYALGLKDGVVWKVGL